MSTAAKQAIGEALDSLSNKVFDHYFQRKENDLMQRQQIVASLFQNQMNLENEYRNQLLDAGVNLPEEYRSSNYIDIVNSAGNQPLLDTLNALYAQSSVNLTNLSNVKSSFAAGQRIAETYAAGADIDGDGIPDVGAFTKGETGVNPFRYSEDEKTKLFQSFEQLGVDPNLANMPGFIEGFDTFNTYEFALNRAGAAAKLKESHIHLANLDLERATKEINIATMDLGPSIIAQLTNSSPIFSKLAVIKNNLKGDKDQVDVATEEWNNLNIAIQTNFPDISTALGSGIANYIERDTIDGVAGPYDGFVSLLSSAYSDLKQYLTVFDPSLVDEDGQWVGDPAYTGLHNRVTQYQQAGVLARDMGGNYDIDLLELATGIDAAKDNVISSLGTINANNAEALLAEGFGYNAINDSLEFIDREGQRFIDFNNETNPAYEAWLEHLRISQEENTETDPNALNVDSIMEGLGQLETEVAKRDALIDENRTLKEEVRRGLNKFAAPNFGQGTGFVWGDNAIEGIAGSQPHNYIPTDTELERISERFIKEQARRLNPNVPNSFLEYIPMVGLLAQLFPQGASGVASEIPKVRKAFEEYNQWIESINQARAKQGEVLAKKLDIQKILEG